MNITGKILVTGATGLVGCHIMIELLSRGYNVCGLRRTTSDCSIAKQVFAYYGKESLWDKIEWREANITDLLSVRDAMTNISIVCNAAAMVSFSHNEHAQMWQVNVEGTANLVSAATEANVELFCHISSIGALGHTSDNTPINEDTPFQPDARRSVYSQSKFRQEMEVWRGIENGLKAVIVNPGVVIGPCSPTRSSGLIAATMQRGTNFYTAGQTGYVDARDVAFAVAALIESNVRNERFILVGENSTVRNVQNIFAQNFGTTPPQRIARSWQLYVAAIACRIGEIFTGTKASLTFETVRTMGGQHIYSAEKIKKTIDIKFHTLSESIANMAAFCKQLNNKTK